MVIFKFRLINSRLYILAVLFAFSVKTIALPIDPFSNDTNIYQRSSSMLSFQVSTAYCGDSSLYSIPEGATIHLFAQPSSLSKKFLRWSDGNSENPRSIRVHNDITYVALFEDVIIQDTITIINSVGGNVSGGGVYNRWSSFNLVANPNPDYEFVCWSDGDTNNPRTFYVEGNAQIWPVFELKKTSLLVRTDDCVLIDTLFYIHTSISLSAQNLYGYHFGHWSDGNFENPRMLELLCDTILQPVYIPNLYAVEGLSNQPDLGNVENIDYANYLDTVVLFAVPNTGNHFTSWSDGNTENPRTFVITCDTSFYANFEPTLYQVKVFSDYPIYGFVSGDTIVNYGVNVPVSASSYYGYHFEHWGDGCTENPRELVITQDTVLFATFDKNFYELRVLSQDSSKGNVYGSSVARYLDTLHVNATPYGDNIFYMWSDGELNPERDVVLTQDSVIYGIFGSSTCDIFAYGTGGYVSGSGSYTYGSYAELEAHPIAHYHFVEWSDGEKNNPRIVHVINNITLVASFALDTCIVSISSNGGQVVGGGIYDYGTYVTLVATPDEGFMFVKWSDGYTDNPYTLFLENDIELEAIFAAMVDIHNVSQSAGIAYCVQRTLYVENLGCEYSVFNSSGQLVYRGKDSSIILPNSGLYIVRMSGNNNKVCAW